MKEGDKVLNLYDEKCEITHIFAYSVEVKRLKDGTLMLFDMNELFPYNESMEE